jgi:anti-sigma factor RsiW
MTGPLGCDDVRLRLLDHQRGLLAGEPAAQLRAHLETCAACAHEDAAEQALSEVLERKLPQHAAPLALKRRLAADWPATMSEPPTVPSWWGRHGVRVLVPAAAMALILLAVVPLYFFDPLTSPRAMVAEAVNDHLRILASQNPIEIPSGGIHQVKPWFEGRLDFAPVLRFPGNEEFPLQGGAVGYFLDRKAAVVIFKRRLHVITLYVFRADGLPWPTHGLERMGHARAYVASARGFNAILWREGELGYALVSDMDRAELTTLGAKLAG